MKKLSFLLICVFALFVLQAQTDSIQPVSKRPSMANIKTVGNKTVTGWLYAVNDSQVVLVKSRYDLSRPISESGFDQKVIAVDQISQISLQKRNSALRGTLIGFAAGALTGIVMGYMSGDDPIQAPPADDPWGLGTLATEIGNSFALTAGQKAAIAGVSLGVTGAITGLIIGALAKKKFIIGGKREKYRDLQGELMMRLVQK